MRSVNTNPADETALCREIAGKFDALAMELGRALDALPPEEAGSDAWARLKSARIMAEEGAARIRASLAPGQLD